MENVYLIVQLAATTCMALIAGLFYAYSCSVNPGLGRLADRDYLAAMQSINKAILNPWFFLSFMGTLILLPLYGWLCYKKGMAGANFYMVVAASIFYAVGVFGVTVVGNVPRNNMLEKFKLEVADEGEIKQFRKNFELPWNRWHRVRTICNIIALLLLLVANMY